MITARKWIRWSCGLAWLSMVMFLGCIGTTPDNNTTWTYTKIALGYSSQPVAVAVADMNRDGLLDVISAWRGSPTGGAGKAAAIVIHFQKEDGQWQTVAVDSGTRYAEVNALAIADINLDTYSDIVVAANESLIYLKAPADATQTNNWQVYEIAASKGDKLKAWYDVVAGQIDGTGPLDLVASLNDDGRVVWFKAPDNPASGEGWTLVNIDASSRKKSDSVVLFDLNGDDRLDVISSAPGESQNVVSWYEQPAGLATATDLAAATWVKHGISSFAGAGRMAIGDLDGDGKVDIASISAADKRAAWLLHPADVTSSWKGWVFAQFNKGGSTRVPIDVAIADVDGDGHNDVIVATSDPGRISWFSAGTDNTVVWNEHVIATFKEANTGLFGLGDIDKDGDIDVVIPGDNTANEAKDAVYWFANPLSTAD